MNDKQKIALAAVILVAVASVLIVACSEGSDGAVARGLPADRESITYSVTFNAGSGATSSYGTYKTFEIKGGSNSIQLPVTSWTKQGYYLSGWASYAYSKTFAPGDEYTAKANDLLIAQWTKYPDNHKEGMDRTLAVGEAYSAGYSIDSSWAPSSTKAMNVQAPDGITGYYNNQTFVWVYHYTFSGTIAKPGIHIVSMENSTYDHGRDWWILTVPSDFDTTCEIKYYSGTKGESGTEYLGSISAPKGTAITLKSDASKSTGSVVTVNGKTLMAWQINDGFDNYPWYPLGSSYTVHGDFDAIAQWYGDAHIAVFIIDGGSLNVQGYVTHTGESFQLLGEADVVEKSGKDFIGWQRVVDGKATDALYAPSLNMTSSEDLIFAAYYIDNGSKTYTVTFDANGGTGGFQQRVKPGMSVYLPTEVQVSLTANNFTGWNVDGNDDILTGTTYTPADTVTLKANWKPQTVPPKEIYISGSSSVRVGGSGLWLYATTKGASDCVRGAMFEITSGDGVYARITEQKVTSYGGECHIEGLKEGGSIKIRAYSIVDSSIEYSKPISVKGELKNYAITYNANGGINAPSATETSSDYDQVNLYVTAERPSKAGWTFNGWNTSSDGKGKEYKAGDVVTLTISNKSLALYAQWTENPHTYYLEYDLGTNAAGEKAPTSVTPQATGTKETSVKMNVTTEKPGWVGYKFLGWSETAKIAGEGTSADVEYNPGDEITISRTSDTSQTSTTKTLYAVWGDNYNTYTLKLDPGEGKFSDGTSEPKEYQIRLVAASYSYQIPADTDPSKDGGKFIGWSVTGSSVIKDGDIVYIAGDYVMMVAHGGSASITLKAIWSDGENSHRISFNADAGDDEVEGMPSDVSNTSDGMLMSNLTFPDNIPLRKTSGDRFYIFAGWYDQNDGESYVPGQSVTIGRNLEVKAIWVPFTLTLNGVHATLTKNESTSGEVYLYWLGTDSVQDRMPSGQTEATYDYQSKGKYDVRIKLSLDGLDSTVTRTLYVDSDPVSFILTYHSNSGTDETDRQYGSNVKIKTCPFDIPPGSYFDSWNTEPDGSGKKYVAGASVTLSEDLDLYAQWGQGQKPNDDKDGVNLIAVLAGLALIVVVGYFIVTRVI